MLASLQAMSMEDQQVDDEAWSIEEEELEKESDWLTAGPAVKNINPIPVLLQSEINDPTSYDLSLGAIVPVPSQTISVKYKGHSFKINLDSGATVSFVTKALVERLNIKMDPNNQLALSLWKYGTD